MSMKKKIVTLTINYPESIEEHLERDILEALSCSGDLRKCFGEIIDIHEAEDGEEGDA